MADTNDVFDNSWFGRIWTRVAPYYETLKTVLVVALIVFNICCISLCISSFLFGTIYFYHMPTIQHTFPLHFHYNRSCMQKHQIVEKRLQWNRHLSEAYTKRCFPVAKIDISSPSNSLLLQEGQTYSVVLKLELPETPGNLKMGMFMSNIVVQGYTAKTLNVGEYRWSKRRNTVEELELPIVKSSSKPMIMRYKSPLLRYAYTAMFWPLLLFDFMHESQVLDELLFEEIMLDQKSYSWTASVYLENPSIEVYSANLDVVARFSGVQYLLYRWPIVSFLFGTAIFFVPTVFVCAILFYFAIWKTFFAAVEVDMRRNMNMHRSSREILETVPVQDVPVQADNIPDDTEPIPTPEPQPNVPEVLPPPDSQEQSQCEHDVHTSFTPPSTSVMTEEFVPPTPRKYSRSSSASSSIEMIGQPNEPPNFSPQDNDEIFTSSSFSLADTVAFNEDEYSAEDALKNVESKETESNIRQRFPK